MKYGSNFGVKSRIIHGTLFSALLIFVVGGWAATAKISGAIIAPGTVVVERYVKKVQHPDGGIVSEILIANGDIVEKNEILIKLDATQIQAELGIITSQMIELIGRKARLEAERDNLNQIEFPDHFLDLGPGGESIIEGETRLLKINRLNQAGKKDQLNSKIEQLRNEIEGLESQRDAEASALQIVKKELGEITELFNKSLTSATRVYALQREATKIKGRHGGLVAQIARAQGKISETKLQILSIDQDIRTDAQKEIRSIEAKISELAERRIAANDRLKRVDIRAPLKGMVHELTAHTIGGVISAADEIMLIVPQNQDLTIEARISPTDVDQITIGQAVKLRFPAFNQRTTPEIQGYLTHISGDVSEDPKTGQIYYVGRIEIDAQSLGELGEKRLIPGMPVEVFVTTEQRTALSYFVKPFSDQIERALREE